MDLVSRLKLYLDSHQISVTQFADECGIPRPTASQLLAGRNKKVSDEIIGKIHQCYPSLNVIWLMFGEGNMESGANIGSSEAEITGLGAFSTAQNVDKQQEQETRHALADDRDAGAEKFHEHISSDMSQETVADRGGNEFVFGNNRSVSDMQPTFDFGRPDVSQKKDEKPAAETDHSPNPIATGSKRKRVIGIVVYYDDSTYESFIPDTDGGIPFMR